MDQENLIAMIGSIYGVCQLKKVERNDCKNGCSYYSAAIPREMRFDLVNQLKKGSFPEKPAEVQFFDGRISVWYDGLKIGLDFLLQ